MNEPAPSDTPNRARLLAARAAHWQRARRVTGLLLLFWFGTTFGTVWFARELDDLALGGWPLSFYLAAQGAALLYLAVIGLYALYMARLDRRYARQLEEGA